MTDRRWIERAGRLAGAIVSRLPAWAGGATVIALAVAICVSRGTPRRNGERPPGADATHTASPALAGVAEARLDILEREVARLLAQVDELSKGAGRDH